MKDYLFAILLTLAFQVTYLAATNVNGVTVTTSTSINGQAGGALNGVTLSGGVGGGGVQRIAGTDSASDAGSTSTHTFTIPATATLMVYTINGFDGGETDKCLDSNFSFEDNSDSALTWHQVEVTSSTVYNAAAWVADVTAEQGNSVHVDADYVAQGSGSWSGGVWQVATFYTGVDLSSLPTSAVEDSAIDAHVSDTAVVTTGALDTVDEGRVVCAYGWFANDGGGAFNSGVTEFYDSTIVSSQTQIIGDVAATGSTVTTTGGDGTISYHSIVGISLK